MPTRTLRSSGVLGLTLLWALAGAALADDNSQASTAGAVPGPKPSVEHTPTEWLQRMNQALNTRNYDGTFSHWQGGRVEMQRIIHRLQDGVVSERQVSLDGSGIEFIRKGASLTCYWPDKREVLVEQFPPKGSLLRLPTVNDQMASFYDIREVAHTRLNRRETHVITVLPKDEYRYGYRLWIDDSTAMPLKTQLCDAHGHVIEQIVFASLTLPAHIPDSLFKPEVSTQGFQWLRNDAAQQSPPGAEALAWNAMRLPPGFRMTVRSARILPGSTNPVDHLVFTDGFASVSVFVERQTAPANQPAVPEAATVGSSSAFSTVIEGHKITAVGEVPPATVRFIATQVTQVKAQGAPAAPPPGPQGR